MNYIQAENLGGLTLNNDFQSSFDGLSGVVEWRHPELDWAVVATPNWETDGIVPIDVVTDDGEYIHVMKLNIDNSPSTASQLDLYLQTILFVSNYHMNN